MSERPWFQINRDLLVYKAFYFFFLSGFGSIFPYLPVYFRQIGLPASQVGLLLGLRPIVQFASAPFWAIMADKYRKRKSVLVMSVLSWLIMTMALAFVEPTNEICEIRQGNDTHNRVYNYTKVKTGFFRRTLLWHKGSSTEDLQQADIVPIYIASQRKKKGRIKSFSSSKIKPASVAVTTHTQLNNSKSKITTQQKAFDSRNTSYFKQHTIPDQEENRLTLNTLSSNRQFSASRNLINNTQQYGLHSKQGPALKTRTDNTLQTTTSRTVAPSSQQINSKHLSRFHKFTNSPGQNKRRKQFSEMNNSKEHRSKVAKPRQTKGANFTSNLASPAKHFEKKNGSSSIDKRRQNKGVPPVVIEFSRIVIPHNKDKIATNSANDETDDSSSHLEGPNVENMTKFAHAHKTVLHSMQPTLDQVSDSISKPLNNSTYKADKTGIKAISKSLLQLEEKLSKIIEFDSKNTLTGNTPLDTSEDELHDLHVKNISVGNASFSNQSLTQTFQIHVRNKNISKEVDKLHQGEGQKSEAEFLIHRIKPAFEISTVDSSNNTQKTLQVNPSNASDLNMELLPLHDSLSGSGSTLPEFPQQTFANNNVTTFNAQKVTIETQIDMEDNESTLQTIHNFTQSNVSDNFQLASSVEGSTETSQGYLILKSQAENTQLEGNMDSELKLWMKNLLKSNSFELKRIFTILLVLVVVGEFLEAPSTTLADASLLEHLGEERRYYGKQRLWGSLGFGLSSFLVGVLLERSRHVVCGDQYTDYMICFCVFALLMVMTLFISTTFKFQYKETDTKNISVLSALCNIHYGSCLVAACFMGVGHGMSHSFLNWFLEDLGATKTLMGVAVICRSSLDLMTFFVAGSLIKAIGQIKIMIFALISYGIAFTLYSLLTNPWWVLPIEMLVGCTYAASWSACTSYMAGASSIESVTTIQGKLLVFSLDPYR
ncbi:uncharacterized protein LOC144660042 isoform X2 [Oculina patagonica]